MAHSTKGDSVAFRVFARLYEVFTKEARGRVFVEIPVGHIDGGIEQGPTLRGNEGYFRIWVSRMFLAHDKEWFSTRYPSVTSFVTFNFGGRDAPLEVANVAGPDHLKDVDKEHLDRVVSLNHAVLPTTPFRGGTVELEAGLLAMEARDEMRRFLNAMGTVASLVAVPQLSAALTVADKVASGAKELAGADGNRLKLGYQNTFVGEDDKPGDPARNELRDRHIAVVNAPADDGRFAAERLWLQGNEVRVGDSSGGAQPLTGVDWMVLRVETLVSRDDYDSLSDITEPLKKAIGALGGDIAQADALAKQAIMAAWNSEDLIDTDRPRVAGKVKEKYKAAKAAVSDGAALVSSDIATIAPDHHEPTSEPTASTVEDALGQLLSV